MIRFLLTYIFTRKSKRTDQMNIDWYWFWHVDVADWWSRVSPLRSVKKRERDDELPF